MEKLPVLVIAFNRPLETAMTMERIAEYEPARLYVASDGPRKHRLEDRELVESVRATLMAPAWKTELSRRFLVENEGPRRAVQGAIDWFFGQEPEGIILEDDCLPSPDFFYLAEHILNRYRHNPTVWGFSGSNIAGIEFQHSYGFIRQPLTWGWATWSDRWRLNDSSLSSYPSYRARASRPWWPSRAHSIAYSRHFDSILKYGRPDAWDYAWAYSVMRHGGLWAIPKVNLIENIGFGTASTNRHPFRFRGHRAKNLDGLSDPSVVEADLSADFQVLKYVHNLETPLWVNYPLNLVRRIRSAITFLLRRKA